MNLESLRTVEKWKSYRALWFLVIPLAGTACIIGLDVINALMK